MNCGENGRSASAIDGDAAVARCHVEFFGMRLSTGARDVERRGMLAPLPLTGRVSGRRDYARRIERSRVGSYYLLTG